MSFFKFPAGLLFIYLTLHFMYSCTPKEEVLTTDSKAKLSFSDNAVVFDTIFTDMTSITRRLKVYNPNKKAVEISKVELGGGANSPYKVLVNGRLTAETGPIRLVGGDSLTLLVQALIAPRDSSLPFTLYDSLLFYTNGNVQNVKLLAWGQDVNVIKSGNSLLCNAIWKAGKPYILYDSITVAEGCQLTLQAGTRVYNYNGAALIIKGSLRVEGTAKQPVVFGGFRQEEDYKDVPGQWKGISFRSTSQNSVIEWAEIKNAVTGISIGSNEVGRVPDLKIASSILKNHSQSGLYARQANVDITNSLITNCARQTFAGLQGGTYAILHCTFANYSLSFARTEPSIVFTNTEPAGIPTRITLNNTILWGNQTEEVVLMKSVAAELTITQSNNIVKTQLPEFSGNNNLVNKDPKFIKPTQYKFGLDTLSPAKDAGKPLGILKDLADKDRDALPDIGAYERKEKQ